MNTVRITMSQAELEEVVHFLESYTAAHKPIHLRLTTGLTEKEKAVAQLIPTLCSRLHLRLCTSMLLRKDQYRLDLAGELALALVHAWLEQGTNEWPRAQVIIGNLHRNLQ